MEIIDKNFHCAALDLEDGAVVVVDKPLGWTSSDVVRKIKFGLQKTGRRNVKVGHAGTLDPLATGVLLVCLGRATKRVEEFQAQEKEYLADFVLGATTPSYDLEHPIDATYPHDHIDRAAIEAALAALCGERMQEPPLYSAKMVEGRRAYEYAREGSEMKLRHALINIYSMAIEEYDHPRVRVRIRCSKGTYIRSIARELGEQLGSGAHLASLRRTRSGAFSAEEGLSVDEALSALGATGGGGGKTL